MRLWLCIVFPKLPLTKRITHHNIIHLPQLFSVLKQCEKPELGQSSFLIAWSVTIFKVHLWIFPCWKLQKLNFCWHFPEDKTWPISFDYLEGVSSDNSFVGAESICSSITNLMFLSLPAGGGDPFVIDTQFHMRISFAHSLHDKYVLLFSKIFTVYMNNLTL